MRQLVVNEVTIVARHVPRAYDLLCDRRRLKAGEGVLILRALACRSPSI